MLTVMGITYKMTDMMGLAASLEAESNFSPIPIVIGNRDFLLVTKEYLGAMRETAYLEGLPGLKEHILRSKNKPSSEFLTEEEFWDDDKI